MQQCAPIWSDKPQRSYTSQLEVIWDQTTSDLLLNNLHLPKKCDRWDFLSRSFGEAFGNYLLREIPKTNQTGQRGQTGNTGQTGQTRKAWLTLFQEWKWISNPQNSFIGLKCKNAFCYRYLVHLIRAEPKLNFQLLQFEPIQLCPFQLTKVEREPQGLQINIKEQKAEGRTANM